MPRIFQTDAVRVNLSGNLNEMPLQSPKGLQRSFAVNSGQMLRLCSLEMLTTQFVGLYNTRKCSRNKLPGSNGGYSMVSRSERFPALFLGSPGAQQGGAFAVKNPHKKDGKALVTDMGSIIGVHAGPGTIAEFFVGDHRYRSG